MKWVIDTNILEHLFDDGESGRNADGHIRDLLESLIIRSASLGMDSKGRILEEYRHRLDFHIKHEDESLNYRQLLSWVVNSSEKEEVVVNHGDQLGRCLRAKMDPAEGTDRVFVYVACRLDCKMATNDAAHIGSIAGDLKKCGAAHAEARNVDFIDSQTALAILNI